MLLQSQVPASTHRVKVASRESVVPVNHLLSVCEGLAKRLFVPGTCDCPLFSTLTQENKEWFFLKS